MRTLKYIIPIWLSLVFYAVAAFVAGPSGVNAYRQLEEEKEKQEKNINVLKQTSLALEGEKEALIYDEDTISVYARNLGYGESGERFVRIVGLGGTLKQPAKQAGEVYAYNEPLYKDDKTIRIIALAIGAAALFIIALADVILFIKRL
ncbi:MAG: septum formation initiator family protein [Spirochaetaceae bacterium]|jgi:cell division protein FtsB|nr:septum formation initiator family protein [Spirochaetaceae bacterium]